MTLLPVALWRTLLRAVRPVTRTSRARPRRNRSRRFRSVLGIPIPYAYRCSFVLHGCCSFRRLQVGLPAMLPVGCVRFIIYLFVPLSGARPGAHFLRPASDDTVAARGLRACSSTFFYKMVGLTPCAPFLTPHAPPRRPGTCSAWGSVADRYA